MARDVQHEDYSVVSVIGDGALTGGMAYEALNNASGIKGNFVIILNDNTMSISKNVGGVSNMLSEIRSSDSYYDLKENIGNVLYKLPKGDKVVKLIQKTKSNLKQVILHDSMFESMGIYYLGPVDGHDMDKLIKILTVAKRINGPVLVHVVTSRQSAIQASFMVLDHLMWRQVWRLINLTGQHIRRCSLILYVK